MIGNAEVLAKVLLAAVCCNRTLGQSASPTILTCLRSIRVVPAALLFAATLVAQPYVISTLAGGVPLPTPVRGVDLPNGAYNSVAVDRAGNAYFPNYNSVLKLDQNGIATRVAGNGRTGYSGDGGPATEAQLGSFGLSLALDGAGSLFIVDRSNHRIRRVAPNGIITTVAGDGTPVKALIDDGVPATSASIGNSNAIAVDSSGNLFIAETDYLAAGPTSPYNVLRKVSPDGIITTVAGRQCAPSAAPCHSSGDGGPSTSAQLGSPRAVSVDGVGNIYIAEADRVRKISLDGIITTVAGTGDYLSAGSGCLLGDGGPAIQACIRPAGVTLDAAGNLFIADYGNVARIRKVSPDGMISTVAGGSANGGSCFADGVSAIGAQLCGPQSIALDSSGNLFIASYENLRKISPDGIIHTVVGSGNTCCFAGGFSGDGGPATSAQLNQPWDVAVDSTGNVFIADQDNRRVRKITPAGIITTVAGNGTFCYEANCPPPGDGGSATKAVLNWPSGVALDGAGNLLIADGGGRLRKVSPDGTITTVAGIGQCSGAYCPAPLGDGGPATSAGVWPVRVTTDSAGNLFIAESYRIRKVSPDGIITTEAGNGGYYFSGDGGPATDASIDTSDEGGCDGPGGGMAVDGAGDLFFADTVNARVREVSGDGIINTVAGIGNPYCYPNCPPPLGDGGPATSAFLAPFDVAFDGAGNLFIADAYNGRIRKVAPGGTITTVAGNGANGYSGDGGPASTAALGKVTGIAVDGAGNIYLASPYDNAVRVLRPSNTSVLIGAVVDAASQKTAPVSPGKIVVIYGAGFGSGAEVYVNGMGAQVLYESATQVAAVVPNEITGASAQVTVTYRGQVSNTLTVPVAPSAPSLFTLNQSGAGQAAAINADGTINTAVNPVKIDGYVSLYATGGGSSNLPVSVTIGGLPATVQYAGSAPGQPAGLMQVNVQIPNGVGPGGYVPVVLKVGEASTADGAAWIAVAGN